MSPNIHLRNATGFGPEALCISEINVWAHFEDPSEATPWTMIGKSPSGTRWGLPGPPIRNANKDSYVRPEMTQVGC
eukprot:2366950-Karenia_brevis.AAC.1